MILLLRTNVDDQLEYDPINDAWQPDDVKQRLAAYQKLGVTHLKWIAVQGSCEECLKNDGVIVPLGSPFPNGNILPQCHPNCQCQVIPVSHHHTVRSIPLTTKVKKIPNLAPGAPSVPAQPDTDERANFFIHIRSIDPDRRMIEGQATVEEEDGYGTVFSYEASKRAFEAWEGNIREMHHDEAVGRALEVEFDDEQKRVLVRCFISKGAESTWQKILDGTLRGFSVGAKAPKSAWKTIERNGKTLPYLTDYKLVELSVVDNPATPKCDFAIIRAEGYTEVLAPDSELEADSAQETQNRDLSTTMDSLHSIRDTAMSQCGCDTCSRFMFGNYGRAEEADVTSHFTPTIQRLDAISAGLATRNIDIASQFAALERQVAALTQLVQQSVQKADETRTELSTIQATVNRVADQPLPGGPVRNTGGQNVSHLDERALIKMAAERGLLSSDDQMAAAAKLLLAGRNKK